MANSYFLNVLIFLLLRQPEIKTTLRHHATRIIKKSNNTCWEGYGKSRNIVHRWWGCKLINTAIMKISLVVCQKIKNITT